MQTWLSTEMDRTAASATLQTVWFCWLRTGRNSRPVTNMEWAPGTCKTLWNKSRGWLAILAAIWGDYLQAKGDKHGNWATKHCANRHKPAIISNGESWNTFVEFCRLSDNTWKEMLRLRENCHKITSKGTFKWMPLLQEGFLLLGAASRISQHVKSWFILALNYSKSDSKNPTSRQSYQGNILSDSKMYNWYIHCVFNKKVVFILYRKYQAPLITGKGQKFDKIEFCFFQQYACNFPVQKWQLNANDSHRNLPFSLCDRRPNHSKLKSQCSLKSISVYLENSE